MQTATSMFWNRVAGSISYDDNPYSKYISQSVGWVTLDQVLFHEIHHQQ